MYLNESQSHFASPGQRARNAYVAERLGLSVEESSVVFVDSSGAVCFTSGSPALLAKLHRRVVSAGLRPSRALEQAAA